MLPMRGPLIGKWDGAACIQFTTCFTFHQHRQTSCDQRQFRFLACNDIRQLLHRFGEVRDLFFKVRYVSHIACLDAAPIERKGNR